MLSRAAHIDSKLSDHVLDVADLDLSPSLFLSVLPLGERGVGATLPHHSKKMPRLNSRPAGATVVEHLPNLLVGGLTVTDHRRS